MALSFVKILHFFFDLLVQLKSHSCKALSTSSLQLNKSQNLYAPRSIINHYYIDSKSLNPPLALLLFFCSNAYPYITHKFECTKTNQHSTHWKSQPTPCISNSCFNGWINPSDKSFHTTTIPISLSFSLKMFVWSALLTFSTTDLTRFDKDLRFEWWKGSNYDLGVVMVSRIPESIHREDKSIDLVSWFFFPILRYFLFFYSYSYS